MTLEPTQVEQPTEPTQVEQPTEPTKPTFHELKIEDEIPTLSKSSGGFFPFWSLAVSREPIAEMIYPNRMVEYYRIKLINREFFIIDKLGVFRIQDGIAKIYNGKVRIYQYYVESMNPIDPRIIPEINKYAKKHKLIEILPIMLNVDEQQIAKELNSTIAKEIIKDPINTRTTIFLDGFRNIDPVHVFNFYVTIKNAGKEAEKLKSHKLTPKIEARFVMMILVGGAIAFAIVASTLVNTGMDLDFFIPKALKGEFILGIKSLFHHFL